MATHDIQSRDFFAVSHINRVKYLLNPICYSLTLKGLEYWSNGVMGYAKE